MARSHAALFPVPAHLVRSSKRRLFAT